MIPQIRGRFILVFFLCFNFIFRIFPQTEPLNAIQYYQIGRDLENQNRMSEANSYYNLAIRICNNEISRNTADNDTYTALCWSLQRQKKYDEVIIWGERALRLFPDEYRILEVMGEADFYLDNYESSLRFMQRYTNSRPRGERAPTAYFFIGEIYRLEGKYRLADMAYTTAVRLEPSVALWWYRLGLVRENSGDTAPARDAYEQALKLNQNYREAAEGLARTNR